MHPFARFKRGHLHLTRLEAFSDGVFAIVVTLLAWLSVYGALVIYLLTPLFYITPPDWHGKTEARPNQQKS